MSDIKYRIPLGNCEIDINREIIDQTVIGSITADTTKYTADITLITADHT